MKQLAHNGALVVEAGFEHRQSDYRVHVLCHYAILFMFWKFKFSSWEPLTLQGLKKHKS